MVTLYDLKERGVLDYHRRLSVDVIKVCVMKETFQEPG